MSRLLFVCSGNTCRSAMAAGLAQHIFGQSHTILSAGAETSTGSPAATNAIIKFFAEDCSMDLPRGASPWGTRYVGKARVREGIASRFAGIPDVHYGNDRHWLCGNMGVSEWTLTGTTTLGVHVEVCGCDHWEFRDGKIIRKDSYWKIVE